MRLLKHPILLLVISIFLFSSCEPTYDELVQEQVDLLVGKSWEQFSPPCSENSTSYNLTFNEDYSGTVERTFSGYNNNGNPAMVTEIDPIFWNIISSNKTMLFTIGAGRYEFNVITVTEDELIFTDYSNSSLNSCIYQLK